MRMQDYDNQPSASEPVFVPPGAGLPRDGGEERPAFDLAALPESAGQVVEALGEMSRRIDDLARNLNCLGYFYDDDDGPRAA